MKRVAAPDAPDPSSERTLMGAVAVTLRSERCECVCGGCDERGPHKPDDCIDVDHEFD